MKSLPLRPNEMEDMELFKEEKVKVKERKEEMVDVVVR